jgi:hypothetical protein
VKKLLFYLFLSCFSLIALASDINLPAKVGLKDNEIHCIMYYKLGNCSKFFMNQQYFVEQLEQLNFEEIRILAVVGCNREKELNIFKKQYVWEYDMIADDGEIRDFYEFETKNDIIILNSSNRILHNNKWNKGNDLKVSYDAVLKILGDLNHARQKKQD